MGVQYVHHGLGHSEDVPLLSVDQVAAELGIHRSSVMRLIASGDLRAINVAPSGARRKTLKVDPDDLAAFKARRATGER
jgi:excisionase family DNA binding protein